MYRNWFKKNAKAKVPNWKLNDINFLQSNLSSKKKCNYNQRKRNFKLGLANHIALNMENEKEDNKKSNINCDHSEYKKVNPCKLGKIYSRWD